MVRINCCVLEGVVHCWACLSERNWWALIRCCPFNMLASFEEPFQWCIWCPTNLHTSRMEEDSHPMLPPPPRAVSQVEAVSFTPAKLVSKYTSYCIVWPHQFLLCVHVFQCYHGWNANSSRKCGSFWDCGRFLHRYGCLVTNAVTMVILNEAHICTYVYGWDLSVCVMFACTQCMGIKIERDYIS